ncbi:MAG: hypothetical protein Q8P41_09525 [Pseudomonadota bacterium]|nr:hypothetical protein [Pseudomonadota bacterium]
MRFLPLCVLSLAFLASTPAHARDWKKAITSDLVTIADGKMKIERFQVCDVKVPNAAQSSLQVRTYAEAPAGGSISRDFFVSFQTAMTVVFKTIVGQSLAGKSGVGPLDALDCNNIDAPIGKVDMEWNFYTTGEGFQLEMVDNATGKTTRESKTWEATFAQ